jgi:hypothetical protein
MSSAALGATARVRSEPRYGRAAGFGYLAIFVTGILWYAPFQGFRAQGDGALIDHLRAGRLLFEVSILAGGATFVAYLVTAVLLYRRYSAEAAIAVSLLFAFVLASVPLSLVGVAREMDLLPLLDASPAPDLQAQVATTLRAFDSISRLSSLFWGLWLLPLAFIAFRSGGSGRPVGVLLSLGGLGYMLGFVKPVLWPSAALGPADMVLAGATVLSELAITLWLLLAADRPGKVTAG